ncbi:MAG: phosphohistidine phosphatase SixA [Anaerolineae bacterium]
MRLYFLRHGHAEDGADDHARQLTRDGAQRVVIAAKVMVKMDIKPKAIFSSPRVRARQTAEIVAEELGLIVDIREEVNFDFDVPKIKTLIAPHGDHDDLMFVGHEPTLSLAVMDLTGGNVEMKKGGLAMVELTSRDPLRGMLVWLIAPRVFEAAYDF